MIITNGIKKRAAFVILYGPPGTGKTTLASKIPNSVFLDLESGTDFLDVSRVALQSSGMRQTLLDLYALRSQYKTLIVDSLSAAEKILTAELLKANNWANLISPGYGQGYKALRGELMKWKDSLEAFRASGINVVLVGHSKSRIVNDEATGESFDRFSFDMDKDAIDMMIAAVDGCFLMKQKTTIVEENGKRRVVGTGKRILLTKDKPGYMAKSRWTELAPEISDPSYENFWKHILVQD